MYYSRNTMVGRKSAAAVPRPSWHAAYQFFFFLVAIPRVPRGGEVNRASSPVQLSGRVVLWLKVGGEYQFFSFRFTEAPHYKNMRSSIPTAVAPNNRLFFLTSIANKLFCQTNKSHGACKQ